MSSPTARRYFYAGKTETLFLPSQRHTVTKRFPFILFFRTSRPSNPYLEALHKVLGRKHEAEHRHQHGEQEHQ